WLSAVMVLLLLARAGSAFGAGPLRPPAGSGGLVAGGLEGFSHAVVLAGLPDHRLGVVLAAVVHGHSHAEREGGLPVANRLTAVAAALVGRDAELGIEPVEGLLPLADRGPAQLRVGGGELRGQASVVRAVAGVQVAAKAVGDLVEGPLLELMTADGGRGLQVLQ